MKYTKILVESKGNILTISINNPEKLNSLNTSILREIDHCLSKLQDNTEVIVVIFTGIGRAFAAGADIAEMKNMTPEESSEYGKLGINVFRKIETLNKITIAAINGYALGGGCELALACDLRIASSKAIFGMPEVSLGVIPGFSGTQRLPRLVGPAKAKEIIYTANMINAEEASKIGLVNKVVDPNDLIEECSFLAEKIIKNSPKALILAKEAIDYGLQTDIETGIYLENKLFALCFSTEDQKEGMSAFLEKRKSNFRKNKTTDHEQ